MTEPGLFELEAVVVGQPKRSWWRRYSGPDLTVSSLEGIPLALVAHIDDTLSLLSEVSGEDVVRIERRTRFGPFEQFAPTSFHFVDAAGHEVGTAGTRGLVKTRQLSLSTEQGRRLFLTRRGNLGLEWRLTETETDLEESPDQSPAPEPLGRVTASTVDRWVGLQQYVVELGSGLGVSERLTVVASVVCLHLLRRPPGGGGPA
ncbi:hypothetical protein FNH09_18400 [Streptomyces adustus]|uniref:Uncharacterized protein n=1 Tax=Streptomyces adustus TaxID=1609272 RepID=A0A5N8VDP9_9ACTN|nr:hypothetical protein [Streptomyces adustus]MPY33159.1 hypothetical protein [Streptomyces adustus]